MVETKEEKIKDPTEGSVSKRFARAKFIIIDKIKPGGQNTYQKYKYIKESQILDAVKPAMIKHGIDYRFEFEIKTTLPVSSTSQKEASLETQESHLLIYKCTIVLFDIVHKEEDVVISWDVPLKDADIQHFGGLTTYMTRYFFLKLLGLATDDNDPDNGRPSRR